MRRILSGASLTLGATIALANGAIAEDNTAIINEINQYNDSNSFAQVNSVFQLRDVSPSDWAFDALRNLVEKYNCLVGYPDGTFRGNRPLSRYEFAAGLNACLSRIEAGGAGVDPAELAQIRAMVQEFEAELATLGARVDDLEGRVDFLEDHQFSTTTKLSGEVIFTLSDSFSDTDNTQVAFNDRVRLALDTSFRADGKDRLRTRLQAGNFDVAIDDILGTDMARLGHDENGGNNITIDESYYRFPLGQKMTAYVGAAGLDIDDIFAATNPYFESSGGGALSRFARRNPTTLRGPEGTGAGFNYKLSDKFTFSALYLAENAADASAKNGLFNGAYSTGAQLAFAPTDNIDLALTYVNKYQPAGDVNTSGSTGSGTSKRPFTNSIPTSSDNFGLEASWMVSPRLNFAGWVGYSAANSETANGSADIWNWAVNAALLDVGGEGNVLGLIFGQPPRSTNADGIGVEDPDTSYLAELQYRYKLSKNITITPGAYVIFNPNHNDANDTVWVGAVRTTFKF